MTQKIFSMLKGLNSNSTLVGIITDNIYGNDHLIYIDNWETYTVLNQNTILTTLRGYGFEAVN
jgi:hypothetical protein